MNRLPRQPENPHAAQLLCVSVNEGFLLGFESLGKLLQLEITLFLVCKQAELKKEEETKGGGGGGGLVLL